MGLPLVRRRNPGSISFFVSASSPSGTCGFPLVGSAIPPTWRLPPFVVSSSFASSLKPKNYLVVSVIPCPPCTLFDFPGFFLAPPPLAAFSFDTVPFFPECQPLPVRSRSVPFAGTLVAAFCFFPSTSSSRGLIHGSGGPSP